MDVPNTVFEPGARPAAIEPVTEEQPAAANVTLPVAVKVFYGAGDAVNSLKAFTFSRFLLFFYVTVLGLPGTLVGLATALGLIWDAVIDPFIGHLSDRSQARWGRRHSFMLVGSLLAGVSLAAVFMPPAGLPTGLLFAWLIGSSLLARSTNSIFMVPYYALGSELSQDYHERTSITGYRAALSLLAGMVAAGAFAVFFPNTGGADPKFNRAGYLAMALAFGLALTVAGLVATLGTLAQRSRLRQAPAAADDVEPGLFASLRVCLRNRSFRVLILSSSLFFLASVVNATLAIHYLTYYARITGSGALSLFQAMFYVGTTAGVPVWVRVAKKVDKHRLYFASALITALLMSAAYWLVGEGRLFGTGRVLPLAIGNAVVGLFASALWCIPASMLADVIDEDELTAGRRRDGTFFGFYSFSQTVAASLATLLTGFLLDRFARLVPGQVRQSAQAIDRLGLLFSPLPAAICVVAACLILRYSLTGQRVATIQAELARRRWLSRRQGDIQGMSYE